VIEDFIQDAQRRMDKSVEAVRTEFNTVRTGRASAALLARITVEYYGPPTPLKQLATISAPEPRLLTVQPFDPSSLKGIERAIQESDLGLTPSNDGKIIRLPIPQLTEERRKELVVKGDVGDDEERRAEDRVQKLTDEHVKAIDELMKHKEAEILEV
jgi:ribosome recycling factor